MNQLLNSELDSLCCQICMEPYKDNKKALITLCSHSFCNTCMKNLKQCPLCRAKIKENNKEKLYYWENNIVLNLIEYCEFLNINADIFLNFPLEFKFCEQCNFFVTNYSYNYHRYINHNLINYHKKIKLFFEKYDMRDKYTNIDDKNKFLTFFLYIYQNPFLTQLKYFQVKNSFCLCETEFKFFGQSLSPIENNLLNKISDVKVKNGPEKWLKGVLLNKKCGIIIHGYFKIKANNYGKCEIDNKIFGFLNLAGINFFGFFEINNFAKKIYNQDDFNILCGILFHNNSYNFGEFTQNKISKGEIFNLKEEGIEIKRIPRLTIDLSNCLFDNEGIHMNIIKKIILIRLKY